ncbi:hypothetical protein [Desertibacillus haloalkaliphilus]|uniref:hypothetical protein n=1 Tax=Desertibacillus haloalkaliphilus TaxID=1328930 RepID=UPI001C2741FD|nr:hypothetical protein [Desertibacillus haloalkaliphilus]MBU8908134.1 hypothetical protein [Desertibacillus haloalkaliphilus]
MDHRYLTDVNRTPTSFPSQPFYFSPETYQLKHHTLSTVEPIVQYGLKEAQVTSYVHAMREVAAISYLMGRGYNTKTAHEIVESWEVNEMF